jgi:hypothetical protein
MLTGLELFNRKSLDKTDELVGLDSGGIVCKDQTLSERIETHPLHGWMVAQDDLNVLGQTIEELWGLQAQPHASPDRVDWITLDKRV